MSRRRSSSIATSGMGGEARFSAARVLQLLLAALLISTVLVGCGKKNAPSPPPDEPNTYPRPYPSE